MNQSAVQDIYLNPEEEDMALTFENQNRKTNSSNVSLDTRFNIQQFKLNAVSQVLRSYISVIYMSIT